MAYATRVRRSPGTRRSCGSPARPAHVQPTHGAEDLRVQAPPRVTHDLHVTTEIAGRISERRQNTGDPQLGAVLSNVPALIIRPPGRCSLLQLTGRSLLLIGTRKRTSWGGISASSSVLDARVPCQSSAGRIEVKNCVAAYVVDEEVEQFFGVGQRTGTPPFLNPVDSRREAPAPLARPSLVQVGRLPRPQGKGDA
jgi:hypothetical protein